MKNKLASLYEQILLNEENSLQGKNNKVGSGTVAGGNKDLFTTTPNPSKENPNKNVKVAGPKELSHKTTSPEDAEGEEEGEVVKKSNTSIPQAPSKSSDTQYSGGKPRTVVGDSLQPMSAFENLFRKTLVNEADDEETMDDEGDELSLDAGSEAPEHSEKESEETVSGSSEEEDEGDLLSDLYDLQSTISNIISKLEKAVEDSDNQVPDEQEYSADDFDQEFGDEGSEEEPEVKAESIDMGRKNKVGKINPKGGKADASIKKVKTGFEKLGKEKGASLQSKGKYKVPAKGAVTGGNKELFQ
jgi:hypothetical protein